MNPKSKTAQIDRLAEAIGYIASEFERFGGLFLEALLEIPMNHQGINIVGHPVGGVIDTVSDSGLVVAEYSDAAGYFDNPMTKAEGDLEKALRRKPGATDIFLLSAKRKRPQIAQDFETRVTTWPAMAGKSLHLWGAEEIALKIVEELVFSDTTVRRLAPYLPELQRIRDEEAVSRLAPAPDRSQLIRANVDAEITRRLGVDPVVTISGIGGLGKSAAASAYVTQHQDEFDLSIWLDAGEVQRSEDLQELTLLRAGEARNVAALLRTRACLLVIDDAAEALRACQLSDLCGPRSRIIITRRLVSPDSYELPLLSQSEARDLLGAGSSEEFLNAFETIWSTVGGHPLSLALIATAVREGAAWADIMLDCQSVREFDDRGQRLADRLLGRLRAMLERELSVFAWANQPTCDLDFLTQVIQPIGIRKVRRHGLTSSDRSGVLRLHDVVFAALATDWCSDARRSELDNAFERYLIAAAEEPGPRLWRVGRTLRRKLELLVETGVRRPAFLYALLMVWDATELRPELVGDPIIEADRLSGLHPEPLQVIMVIEAVEQLFLHDKFEGDDIAKTRLRTRLPVFDKLAALSGLTDRQIAEIKHHRGKALKRLGDPSAAEHFEKVLAGPVPLHESRLQLIDIYRASPDKVTRVIQLVDEILERRTGDQPVSYSVLLGVIERLPWGSGTWRAELIERHAATIESTIVEAANVGIQQAFHAFAQLGRYLSTEKPEMFQRIFERLPELSAETLQTDSDKFAMAEIYFEAARVKGNDATRLRGEALTLYEAEVRPQAFHLQRRSELLIEMKRAAEAETLLRARTDLERSEWLQRLMARARLEQGDPSEALTWIDKALAGLKAEQFRSEFLELRFEIRTALDDRGAIEDLRNARQTSQKVAESARLDARILQAEIATRVAVSGSE